MSSVLCPHVAIIMDGNRRWAESSGFSRFDGHAEGAKNAVSIVDYCIESGIVECLTLYAFSADNWEREEEEVSLLMSLFKKNFLDNFNNLNRKNVCIKFVGDVGSFDDDMQSKMHDIEEGTSNNSAFRLNIAMGYSGRREIIGVVKSIINSGINAGDVNECLIKKFLSLDSYPDFLIRTGGEYRISDFLLWQVAYAEMFFSKKMWPEFTTEDFKAAIEDYTKRDRRYGL